MCYTIITKFKIDFNKYHCTQIANVAKFKSFNTIYKTGMSLQKKKETIALNFKLTHLYHLFIKVLNNDANYRCLYRLLFSPYKLFAC
jgi:hypothetical protein